MHIYIRIPDMYYVYTLDSFIILFSYSVLIIEIYSFSHLNIFSISLNSLPLQKKEIYYQLQTDYTLRYD